MKKKPIWGTRVGLRPEIVIQIIAAIILSLLGAFFQSSGDDFFSLIPKVLLGDEVARNSFQELFLGYLPIILFFILLTISLYQYARWTTRQVVVQEVTQSLSQLEEFGFFDYLFLVPLFRSRVRITVASGILLYV